MKFDKIKYADESMEVYGTREGSLTYIISYDKEAKEFRASVKVQGATPFDGTRYDLNGAFSTMREAVQACDNFKNRKN